MDWTDEVLNDGWARRLLDVYKNGVYEMCDNLVSGGAEVEEAALYAYATLTSIDESLADLWSYYIDMWQEERGVLD